MKILLKRGRMKCAPGDRKTLPDTTDIWCIDKQLPCRKKTKVGCAHVKESCTRYTIPLGSIPIGNHYLSCEDVPCDEKNVIIIDGKKEESHKFEKREYRKTC